MGSYTTSIADTDQIKAIVRALESGYTHKGIKHRSNYQIAAMVRLQANLGCRIGDIVHLEVENIVYDGEAWRLNLIEQKTGKERRYIIATPVKKVIDDWMRMKCITTGRLFTIEEHAVWKQLRAVTDYLGYKNISAHSFRKAASLRVYNDSGKDIALTCQYLNHASPATTMRYLQRSSKQMDELLSKSAIMV